MVDISIVFDVYMKPDLITMVDIWLIYGLYIDISILTWSINQHNWAPPCTWVRTVFLP